MLGIFTLYMAVDCIRLTIGSAQIRVSMGFEPILNPIVCELELLDRALLLQSYMPPSMFFRWSFILNYRCLF